MQQHSTYVKAATTVELWACVPLACDIYNSKYLALLKCCYPFLFSNQCYIFPGLKKVLICSSNTPKHLLHSFKCNLRLSPESGYCDTISRSWILIIHMQCTTLLNDFFRWVYVSCWLLSSFRCTCIWVMVWLVLICVKNTNWAWGELAQMVKCLLSMQEVLGSIPRFSNGFFHQSISFWEVCITSEEQCMCCNQLCVSLINYQFFCKYCVNTNLRLL